MHQWSRLAPGYLGHCTHFEIILLFRLKMKMFSIEKGPQKFEFTVIFPQLEKANSNFSTATLPCT